MPDHSIVSNYSAKLHSLGLQWMIIIRGCTQRSGIILLPNEKISQDRAALAVGFGGLLRCNLISALTVCSAIAIFLKNEEALKLDATDLYCLYAIVTFGITM